MTKKTCRRKQMTKGIHPRRVGARENYYRALRRDFDELDIVADLMPWETRIELQSLHN